MLRFPVLFAVLLVGAFAASVPEIQEQSTKYYEEASEDPGKVVSQEENDKGQGSSEEDNASDGVICPPSAGSEDEDVVLLPNPKECSSFYMCTNGVPVRLNCPAGLQFNREKRVCDFPSEAKCT